VPVVFVHDALETSIVWEPLREVLSRESLALALPGFGAELPSGLSATKDSYASWLEAELTAIDGPIDLVGHGLGAVLGLRLVTARETAIRSWAVDLANVFHPDYTWHRTARIWQTPGAGEEALARISADDPEGGRRGAARLEQLGFPAETARTMTAAHNRTMSQCILSLYRSAKPNVRADWRIENAAGAIPPGLVLHAAADPFGNEPMSDDVASELAATKARLDDLGHCWMVEDPVYVGQILERFWGAL
jgi:pimeloyl-ACP methyl ester carboxylesterase